MILFSSGLNNCFFADPEIECPSSPLLIGQNGVVSFTAPQTSGFRGRVSVTYKNELNEVIDSLKHGNQVTLTTSDAGIITVRAQGNGRYHSLRATCQITIITG